MTRTKFLALCAGKKNNKGFRAYREQFYGRRQQVTYRVCLDPGVGFPSGHAVLYTTTNLANACNAVDRFNMWLIQEGLYRDHRQSGVKGSCPRCNGTGTIDYPEGKARVDCPVCGGKGHEA